MPQNRVVKVLLILVLVLLVPFLIGRITAAILEATYPRPAYQPVAGNLPSEARAAALSLERVRILTRITLVVIAVYYVLLIVVWFILRRRQRGLLRS